MMEDIFQRQIEFQNILGSNVESQQFKNTMLYALIAEVVEAGNETSWKPWKQNQQFNRDRFIEELADIQLFLLNLVLTTGLKWEDFERMIEAKQTINLERQLNDY